MESKDVVFQPRFPFGEVRWPACGHSTGSGSETRAQYPEPQLMLFSPGKLSALPHGAGPLTEAPGCLLLSSWMLLPLLSFQKWSRSRPSPSLTTWGGPHGSCPSRREPHCCCTTEPPRTGGRVVTTAWTGSSRIST